MEVFNIVSVSRKDDFSIVLSIKDPVSGEIDEKHFTSIRMGIRWPTFTSPAYFVVLGQEFSGSNRSGKRQVIGEYENGSIGMDRFYEKIVQVADRIHCRTLYAVLPEDPYECGYLQDLEKYARDKECSLNIQKVESVDDFLLSVSRVKDGIDNDSLLIQENTVIFEQLKGITREDLLDHPVDRFYSIAALGHAIDGFSRYPPVNRPYIDRPNAPY